MGCAWDYDAPTTAKVTSSASCPRGSSQRRPVSRTAHSHHAASQHGDGDRQRLGAGIHPRDKSGYGDRAARVARGFAYGEKIEYLGPVYESHVVDGNKVRVRFTHVGQGLAHRNGDKLQGFAIAGEDNKFVWADAVIDGDTVVVQAEGIAKPVAVRYGWAANQTWANLFNKWACRRFRSARIVERSAVTSPLGAVRPVASCRRSPPPADFAADFAMEIFCRTRDNRTVPIRPVQRSAGSTESSRGAARPFRLLCRSLISPPTP